MKVWSSASACWSLRSRCGMSTSSTSAPARSRPEGMSQKSVDLSRLDELARTEAFDERGIDRRSGGCPVETEPARGVALRIKVNDKDPAPVERQIGSEIDDSCGLADAALLVRASDDVAHSTAEAVRIHVS